MRVGVAIALGFVIATAIAGGRAHAEPLNATVLTAGFVDLRTPTGEGSFVRFGNGASLSLLTVSTNEREAFSLGIGIGAEVLDGPGGTIFDIPISLVWTVRLTDETADPLIAWGLDLGYADLQSADDAAAVLGVHGALGLHGFLLGPLYWRVDIGFVGAGASGIRSELAVGYDLN